MAFLNGENGRHHVVLNLLLKPAQQLGDVEALANLARGNDTAASLIFDVLARFLLSGVANLLLVMFATVHVNGFEIRSAFGLEVVAGAAAAVVATAGPVTVA